MLFDELFEADVVLKGKGKIIFSSVFHIFSIWIWLQHLLVCTLLESHTYLKLTLQIYYDQSGAPYIQNYLNTMLLDKQKDIESEKRNM